MDYLEEQNNEIEALDSIYCEDFEVVSREPMPAVRIRVKSDGWEEGESESGISCWLRFELTPSYPDELPVIAVEDGDNLDKEHEDQLLEFLEEQGRENVGMAMVFTLVSAALEWINLTSERLLKEREERELSKKKQEEEAELKKFEGTRVTIETFMVWKQKFEADLGLAEKRERLEGGGKPTGKQLFLLDKSLNDSDLRFLQEAGETVQVDESLFQEFDDLDMEGAQFSEEEED